MSEGFARRFPALFHVTDRAALPSIARHGLLSAEALCASLGVADAAALLGVNRRGWVEIAGPGGRAALRLQGMPDGPLAARLAPGITPEAWRRFINGQVHLWASGADARRLRAFHPERDQVVLRFATAELLAAGCALRVSAFNNGYLDRSPPARRRLRHPDDYRAVAAWRPGERVREVAIRGGLPASLPFTLAEG